MRDGYIPFWLTIDSLFSHLTHSTWNRTDLESAPDSWQVSCPLVRRKTAGLAILHFLDERKLLSLVHGLAEQGLRHCTA